MTLAHIFSAAPDPRIPRATEARLTLLHSAAKLGLKGDALALAANMTPTEYRRLRQMDERVDLAELQGRADGEMEMASSLYAAAQQGDAKAALEVLKHSHGWVSKQQISVDVEQRISITGALEMAKQRVIEGAYKEVTPDALPQDSQT